MTDKGDSDALEVIKYENVTPDLFQNVIQPKRKPAILKDIYIGDCVEKWTSEYLSKKVGSLPVIVHAGNEGKMNFLTKNFSYKTLLFNEFIKLSSKNINSGDSDDKLEKFYYLRSVSNERRGKKVANIKNEFPTIAEDIRLPNLFPESKFFSSVLRIGSAGVQLWTHYDVLDNLLIQVQGKKRVVLFDPSDAFFLYLQGDKSEVMDIDAPDLSKYPKFKFAKRYECILETGDILFLPAFWFHNTLALSFCINVNIFWKNLDDELYDKNDFYGNKDLLPASKMLQMITNAVKNLQVLPDEYQDFYARRAIITIEKLLLKDNVNENKDIKN